MTQAMNVTATTVSTQDPLFLMLVGFATVGVIVTMFFIVRLWIHTADRLVDMEDDIQTLKEKVEELGK